MRMTDVAVVGSGPAGIAAALAATEHGADVTLIDEGPGPGGHLRWTLAVQHGLNGDLSGKRGIEIARWADEALRSRGIALLFESVVWGLFDDNILGVVTGDQAFELQAASVIVAAGATDIVQPFPGWERPGVMTSTAAQRFMHLHRVLPGHRFAVIGAGPLSSEVASDIETAGGIVAARAHDPGEVEAGGDGEVEWIAIEGTRSKVDSIVLAIGRQPDPELALQAQCDAGYSPIDGAVVPLRSESLETSVRALYVVGDAAGICTTAEAMAEGRVAGLAAVGGTGIREAIGVLNALRTPERREDLQRLHTLTATSW